MTDPLSPLLLLLLVHLASDAKASCLQRDPHSLVCIQISANQIYVGGSAVLQCLHVQTRQPVKVVRWEVNGTVLHRSTSLSKLAIQKANVSDTGNYSCFARLNNQIHVAYVKLRVYGPIITRPVPPTTTEIGSTVTLQCNAENYLTIGWFRGIRSNPGPYGLDPLRTRKIKSALVITDVRLSDNGTYTCELTSISAVDQKVELIVLVSNNISLDSTNISDSHPSVSPSIALVSDKDSVKFLLSNGEAPGTMLESTSCPTASIEGNDFPSWVVPVVIVSSLFGIASLIAASYCLFRYCPRQSKKSCSLSAENPTYTLTTVSQSGQQARGNGLHLYETMSAIKNRETEQDVDSAGYSLIHTHKAETMDASPTSITELLPQDNSSYMVMKKQQNEEREEHTKTTVENQEENGKREEHGNPIEKGKSPYVNMDDPELE